MDLMEDEELFLPRRWNGIDFSVSLGKLFRYYIEKIGKSGVKKEEEEKIERICFLILKSVEMYLNGFTAYAYDAFCEMMDLLENVPLKLEGGGFPELFRIVGVRENRIFPGTRVFHVPYTLRSKVSAGRYSIAGCPSLYLGTSLELCSQEVKLDLGKGLGLASRFRIREDKEEIQILEMALKPQDFTGKGNRLIPQGSLTSEVRSHYLLWYPVIAACSFIRVHREESFTVEYIVPQLLMQWVRRRMTGSGLIGLRYFSCVSVRASQMGFNYIFPASGKMISLEKPYCPVLTHFFDMTDPVFLQEYETLGECEKDLINHRRPHPVIFK